LGSNLSNDGDGHSGGKKHKHKRKHR
jgi:hypothetical protein